MKNNTILYLLAGYTAYRLLSSPENKTMAGIGATGKRKVNEPKILPAYYFEEYLQFRGKWREAIKYLIEQQKGIAVGALNQPMLGDIDLVWGEYKDDRTNNGYGLAKIVAKHPEVLPNMQYILQKMIPTFINKKKWLQACR